MPATLNMTYGHALFNTELWDKMEGEHCWYDGINFNKPPSQACMGYLDEFNALIADIDLYSIYHGLDGTNVGPKCSAQENEAYKKAMKLGLVQEMQRRPFKKNSFTGEYTPWHNTAAKQQARDNNEKVHECLGGDPLSSYLNNALVKSALHIKAESHAWSDCSNIDYTILEKGSQWIYQALKGQIKMLHYSGDSDGVVPTQGTLEWMNRLGWKETTPWKAFTMAGSTGEASKQTGGYFWGLEGLDFGSVHGAGHMVPMDQPARAYQLVVNWMLGKPIDPNWTVTDQNDNDVLIQ